MISTLSFHRWRRDIVFITGAYIVLLLLTVIINYLLAGFEDPLHPTNLVATISDMLYFSSILITLIAAVMIADIPLIIVPVIVLPPSIFVLEQYFSFRYEFDASFVVLYRYDMWNYLAVSLLIIIAFLRKENEGKDYLALAGWSVFVFGEVFAGSMDIFGSRMPFFIPLLAALIFWIPALWIGSRRSSSH